VPSGSAAAEFPSEKLGRDVACESGPEYRVLNWLEKSPVVHWYQEQPVAVPYSFGGRNRVYYPTDWMREQRLKGEQEGLTLQALERKLSVAPMMDWTD
jgi:hypothetical protein